jgi:hypothetical protein
MLHPSLRPVLRKRAELLRELVDGDGWPSAISDNGFTFVGSGVSKRVYRDSVTGYAFKVFSGFDTMAYDYEMSNLRHITENVVPLLPDNVRVPEWLGFNGINIMAQQFVNGVTIEDALIARGYGYYEVADVWDEFEALFNNIDPTLSDCHYQNVMVTRDAYWLVDT